MSNGKGTPLVFIHGNSSSKAIFENQIKALGDTHQVICFDLPGHGSSDNAKDTKTYSFPGYADVIIEALGSLKSNLPFSVVGP